MKSKIEWTERTWNPTVGCSKESAGCVNCYALRMANRLAEIPATEGIYCHTVRHTAYGPEWSGNIYSLPARLLQPYRWQRPSLVFVDSMSDLFHPEVEESFIDRVMAVIKETPRHTYQILTKRAQRMADYFVDKELPPNLWVGVTIENQEMVMTRIRHLQSINAAIRFLSCEPLLGPLPRIDLTDIDWVIAGGESGPGFRPMDVEWVRDLRDQCVASNVPFFFKQYAGLRNKDRGCLLDGVEWKQMPSKKSLAPNCL